jgi:hypothetical protein
VPIHLWLLEQEAFFGGNIEAAEFRPFLVSRYIVARHTGKMFVRCASGFLTVQLTKSEGLYRQDRSKKAENGQHSNTVHFRFRNLPDSLQNKPMAVAAAQPRSPV